MINYNREVDLWPIDVSCHTREELIDQILLHCSKARMLWQLLFSLFGISWVMHSSVKETLLGWHDSFVKRKQKKVWEPVLLCLFFWIIWKEQYSKSLENVELFDHRLKVLFLCSLFSWSKLFIGERLLSILISLIEWVRFKGGGIFCFSIPSLFNTYLLSIKKKLS